ncbi:MAG: 30S ribosomal protein S18 [Deltaproteobacteria bacterium]|nr:30S ribosomal protein S18 [Deltaproteobacteria bacterium]
MPRPTDRGTRGPQRRNAANTNTNDDKFPARRRLRRKVCRFCADKGAGINYKDNRTLEDFVSERGKIIPSRITGTCAWHQRKLTRSIKQARAIALLPYASSRL